MIINQKLKTKNFSLGFSPCPNDTFMFDALVNGRINSGNLSFNVQLEDIETLNKLALKGELDITKISFAVYPHIQDMYELLTSGSALGIGVGPLFISKKEFLNPEKEIRTVAIPGKNTTAYFLFKMFFPELSKTTKEIVFSNIEKAILDDEVDAGIIIHENRFTYESKGLKKISDLGELWENKTGQPIPLGGIAVRRNLDENIKRKINSLVKESVEFALANPEVSHDYVKINAQEMSENVRKKHIQLYVNEYSIELRENGKKSITEFLKSETINELNVHKENIFIQ